jgi:hypothetical protein
MGRFGAAICVIDKTNAAIGFAAGAEIHDKPALRANRQRASSQSKIDVGALI